MPALEILPKDEMQYFEQYEMLNIVYRDGYFYLIDYGHYAHARIKSPEKLLQALRINGGRPGAIPKLFGRPRYRTIHTEQQKIKYGRRQATKTLSQLQLDLLDF